MENDDHMDVGDTTANSSETADDDNGCLGGMPDEIMHAILNGRWLAPWLFTVRAVCRHWRDLTEGTGSHRRVEVGARENECFCGPRPAGAVAKCCCSACSEYRHALYDREGRIRGGAVQVRASTIVEWTDLRSDLWDPAPSELLAWCMMVGHAPERWAWAVLVASNREALVRHVADAISMEASVYGSWALTAVAAYGTGTIAQRAISAAVARGTDATLRVLLAVAPQFFADCHRGHHYEYFEAAVKADKADVVELMLYHGYDPTKRQTWPESEEEGCPDEYKPWYMIEKWGARSVLQRLLDLRRRGWTAKNGSVPALLLEPEWNPQWSILSGPLLDVLREADEPIDLGRLFEMACAESRIDPIAWAFARYGARLGEETLVGLARKAVEARYQLAWPDEPWKSPLERSESRPEAVLRWLFDPDGGAFVPSVGALGDIVQHVLDLGLEYRADTGCALYLLERWPREAAALGPDLIARVVGYVCSAGELRFRCDRCWLWCDCARGAVTGALLERTVRVLDGLCGHAKEEEEEDARPNGPHTVLAARVDLWQLLAEVAHSQWLAGRIRVHFGTCVMLRYARDRCTGGAHRNDDRLAADPKYAQAPQASWARWCHVQALSISALRPPGWEDDLLRVRPQCCASSSGCPLEFDVVAWLRGHGLLRLP